MARPRKATSVMEAKGAFDRQPERRRDPEPQNKSPVGNAPHYFTQSQREAWHDFVKNAPPGVLSASERTLVEMIARLKSEIRESDDVKTNVFSRLESLIARCGCTPADRQRVGVAPPKDANEFDSI